ncbi:hypothetical protein KP509_23G033200 [Ceratopteris richardii]|uniref:Amine oxidase domain-containing protein n=1 Tax=Ceratopteris richardii TaxID=49495 RepID=A0A8T2RYR4_CERRI|nr:hypothetical protein KP509_23G033200 [Ceratopteris richardii]
MTENLPALACDFRPRVIIVGGGMAGLSAAHHLTAVAPGKFNLILLEANNRLGGRICSSSIHGEVIEMGATWIHGIEGSPLYGIADRMHLMQGASPWECMDGFPDAPIVITEGGDLIPSHIVDSFDDLYKKLYEVIQYTEGGMQQFSEFISGFSTEEFRRLRESLKGASVAEYLREGFRSYVTMPQENGDNGSQSKGQAQRNSSSSWSVRAMQEGVFRMRQNVERSVTGADSLSDLDMESNSEYWEYPGEHKTIGHGYSSIIEYLAQTLPNKIIRFNKRVTKIAWSGNMQTAPLCIHCDDGTSYDAEHVIVTVSLGVLKQEVPSADGAKPATLIRLFDPPLPAWKLSAISRLGFGVVDKCFIAMKPNSQGSIYPHMQLVFREESHQDHIEDIDHSPWWMKKNFSFYPIHKHSHVLCTWLTGKEAMEMERLSDEEVITGILRTMKSFGFGEINDCSNDVGIVQQTFKSPETRILRSNVRGLKRSKWGSNPLFRGSYSYVAVGSSGADIDVLAEPLPRSAPPPDVAVASLCPTEGRPLQLLFAGEATHRHCYSTTHGAFLSGVREAERLMKHYELKESTG